MKKIVEVPFIIELAEWHVLSEVVPTEEILKRLSRSLERELERMIEENVYFNPNDKDIA